MKNILAFQQRIKLTMLACLLPITASYISGARVWEHGKKLLRMRWCPTIPSQRSKHEASI